MFIIYRNNLIIILFLSLLNLHLSNEEPRDISCDGVIQHMIDTFDVKDCTLDSTRLNCTTYIDNVKSKNSIPVVLEIRTSYSFSKIFDKSNAHGYTECLDIMDLIIEQVESSSSSQNVFSLPEFNSFTNLKVTLKEFYMHVNFSLEFIVGLLKMKPDCKSYNTACIDKVTIRSFILAPNKNDFEEHTVNTERFKSFYLSSTEATVEELKIKIDESLAVSSISSYFTFVMSQLKSVDFSDNKFAPNSALTNLEYLIKLNLRNCGLSTLNHFLVGTPNIAHLDLSRNVLTSASNLSELTQLEYVDMSDQRTSHTFELGDALNTLKKLKTLKLSHLHLSEIDQSSLKYSPLLEDLDLSYCNFTEIPENTFENLHNLNIIKLNNNKISKIELKTFLNMKCDGMVNLESNKLTGKQDINLNSNCDIKLIPEDKFNKIFIGDGSTSFIVGIVFGVIGLILVAVGAGILIKRRSGNRQL